MTQPKAARISPDSGAVAYGAAGLAGAIYLGAFAASFFGQASLASYMLIPQQLQYVVPAVVDLALILFTIATLIRRSRGESTLITNLATAFWTLVSIAANVLHVLVPAGPQSTWTAGTLTGAALSALMPLATLGASLVLENVLIAPPKADVQPETKAETAPPVVAVSAPKIKTEDQAVRVTVPAAALTAVSEPTPHTPNPGAAPVAAAPAPRKPAVSKTGPVQKEVWSDLSEDEKVDLVRRMRNDRGMSIPAVAKELGVSPSTIKRLPVRELQPA